MEGGPASFCQGQGVASSVKEKFLNKKTFQYKFEMSHTAFYLTFSDDDCRLLCVKLYTHHYLYKISEKNPKKDFHYHTLL